LMVPLFPGGFDAEDVPAPPKTAARTIPATAASPPPDGQHPRSRVPRSYELLHRATSCPG
jgi:hypothetical protein